MLLHGSMDRAAGMARVSRALSGLHVVRYDRRGYGRSVTAGPADLERHVADAAELVAGRRTVVFGHSYGGVVALALGQRHPHLVAGAVVYEAPMPWCPWWPSTNGADPHEGAAHPGQVAEAFLRRMLGDQRWERLSERTRAERRAEGPALVADLSSLRTGGAPYDPAAITFPLVVMRGTQSSAHLMKAADVLADEVAGAKLRVVDGASHGGHLSHPDVVAAAVRTVVARVGSG